MEAAGQSFSSSFPWSTRPDFKTLAHNALNANKAHQYALTVYAEKLSAELAELETLLVRSLTCPRGRSQLSLKQAAADVDDGQEELDTEVQIPGAMKPCGPCHVSEFLNPVRFPIFKPVLFLTSLIGLPVL